MAPLKKVAVLGGGIAGIAAALRLASRGCAVHLYEEETELGGIYRPFQFGDARWDRHPHRILTTDQAFLGLLEEIGVAGRVTWADGRIALRTGGKTWSLAEPRDVMRFTPLKFLDRLRLGWTVFKAARRPHGGDLAGITARDWVVKQAGQPCWELVFSPLLRLLVGEDAGRVSALFLRESMRRAAVSRYGSRDRKGYGYLQGGLNAAWERLPEIFRERGVECSMGTGIRQVRIEEGSKVVVEPEGGETRAFDEVFLTWPEPKVLEALHPSIPRDVFGPEVPYLGLISVACVGDWSLSEHAITYHTEEGVPFSGIVEMTRLAATVEISGRHLMFLMRFTAPGDPFASMKDAEVAQAFFKGLEKLYDEETRDGVREHWVFREEAFRPLPLAAAPGGAAQPHGGAAALVPAPGIRCLNTRRLHFGAADGEGATRLALEVCDAISPATPS